MNSKILFVLLLMQGICVEAFSQNLVYTKNFRDTSGWDFFFGSGIDSSLNIMDTSYSGINNNSLVLWAQQGGGCIGASAYFTDKTPPFEELHKFIIKVFYKKLECFSGFPENCFATNIMGHYVYMYFDTYFIDNPFVLKINYDDSLSIKINNQEVESHEKHEWFSDPSNILTFNFSVKACRADLMAWAAMEVDSIQIYDLEPGIGINDKIDDFEDITLVNHNSDYFLHFPARESNSYRVSIYNIKGQLIHKTIFNAQKMLLSKYLTDHGIYFVQVISKNQMKTFKLLH